MREVDGTTLLVDDDGRVAPVDEVYVFPITRFSGRDLEAEPLPEGRTLAWAVEYTGTPVLEAPTPVTRLGTPSGTPTAHLPLHTELELGARARDGWWEVERGADGWVNAVRGLRVWEPGPVREDVGPDEVWIDIHLAEQTLTLWRGSTPIYATLVSSGLSPHATPLGTFRVADKSVWWDMASRAGAAEPYHVEAVPWTLHFAPRYAIHGAYWHWGFGHPASHGCVNLAPRDARAVFERVSPALPDGWHTVEAVEAHPGSVVRIR